jgi:2'-hydroxyisoflavone reductase
VRYALARGHRVTLFNRGKRPQQWPAGVEELTGDRDINDYASLKGRDWDVVIDNPTAVPHWVRDAAAVLKGHTRHYIFISTVSVYADMSKPGRDANSPVEPYRGKDAMAETMAGMRANRALYGPLKALSEKEAEKQFPGITTVIRPGLIVGPGDETDRFTYWPVRIAKGGDVVAPGDGNDPVQIIDARDLAQWTIRMAEQRAFGIYNGVGPDYEMSMAAMLYGIRAVTTAGARFRWLPTAFLEKHEIRRWSDMPVWMPGQGETAGFHRTSVASSLAKGLTFRPLATTAADTLAWFEQQPAERKAQLLAGLTPEREMKLLAAWKQVAPG